MVIVVYRIIVANRRCGSTDWFMRAVYLGRCSVLGPNARGRQDDGRHGDVETIETPAG